MRQVIWYNKLQREHSRRHSLTWSSISIQLLLPTDLRSFFLIDKNRHFSAAQNGKFDSIQSRQFVRFDPLWTTNFSTFFPTYSIQIVCVEPHIECIHAPILFDQRALTDWVSGCILWRCWLIWFDCECNGEIAAHSSPVHRNQIPFMALDSLLFLCCQLMRLRRVFCVFMSLVYVYRADTITHTVIIICYFFNRYRYLRIYKRETQAI